jgi:UDPglucose 6-dehydrogenase
MIGAGYVGLVSGACFSEFGFHVNCVDANEERVAQLQAGDIPIYEPGLSDLVQRNTKAGRLHFTTDLAASVAASDVVFVAVGTPGRTGSDEADLSQLWAAVDQVAAALKPGAVVVTKSTVVVGTTAKVRAAIERARPGLDFSVASNPEFLREGSALEDFMRPDRVVVGVEDDRARDALANLYRPLNLREAPVLFTSLENAELIKYASNAFLAMKITFINQMADLCEKAGGDVQHIAKGLGLDARIGAKFLHAGPGYGGSCFPKDTKALAVTGRQLGAPISLIEKVIEINEDRKLAMADKIISALGDPAGKTVCVLGVSFKPNTDDMRDAPSLAIIPRLQQAGITVRASDPAAMDNARAMLDGVEWVDNEYDAAEGADAVAILTEWNAYRGLDLERLGALMKTPVMIDLRNIYRLVDVAGTGFRYISIGRPEVSE